MIQEVWMTTALALSGAQWILTIASNWRIIVSLSNVAGQTACFL